MPTKPLTLYQKYHTSALYNLAVKYNAGETKIVMTLLQGTVNTRELPHTFALLKRFLPSVLRSICYNENDYPFYRESQHTEIGHLFEHILIEYLCLLKVSQGFDNVEYSGVTKWNWVLHPKGTFHITVSAGSKDSEIFQLAMGKSIELINLILQSGQKIVAHSPYQLHSEIDPNAQLIVTTPN